MSTQYQPYPPQAPVPQPQRQKGSGLGIAALVLGIVSLVFCWIPFLNILFIVCGIVGLILGIVGIFTSHRVMSIVGSALALLGVILGIAVSAAAAGAVNSAVDSARSSAPATGSPAAPAADAPASTTQDDAKPLPVGTPGTDGGLRFTVTGVDTAHSIGSGVLASTAQGKYVLVTVTVKNVSDASVTFSTALSQVALDGSGNRYQPSSDALMSGNQADQNSFYQPINPGNTVHGRLVFDVPRDVTLAAVTLHGGALSQGVTMALH